ncbi:4-alpha-glucanotransferase [Chelativorans sp. Marseille-P2723]|uniref:4-alpha-glucanotransferase n=1 Tax=Chelativorans sp. Marseille-P2723 TaxID=2709133 RepID=UPI0032B1E933
MDRANLLGYRIFYFERSEQGFIPPDRWPRSALACVGSHDTSTLAGWWTGSDIDLRERIGLYDTEGADGQRKLRARQKQQAINLLDSMSMTGVSKEFNETTCAAIHRLVAKTPSRLAAAQMEDLLGVAGQANIPGTVDQHPNWQRKLPVPIEELEASQMFGAVIEAIVQERPRLS